MRIPIKKNRNFNFMQTMSLYLFFLYSLFVYSFLNTIGVFYATNRMFLVLIVILVLVLYSKKLLTSLFLTQDLSSQIIKIYLIYISMSFLIYAVLKDVTVYEIMPFILHSFLPIIFYFIFLTDANKESIVKLIIFSTFFNVIIGLLFFSILPFFHYFKTIVPLIIYSGIQGQIAHRLSSMVGIAVILGYMSQLCFAIVLFHFRKRLVEYFYLVIFFCGSILSFQRGVWIGLFICIVFYIVGQKSCAKKIVFRLFSVFIIFMIAFFILNNAEILSDVNRLFRLRIAKLDINLIMEERSDVQIIFNKDDMVQILFGEGYGKYSPLNPSDNFEQPDAPYYMVYNETGIVGLLLFLSMFVTQIILSIKNRNLFMLYFTSHILIQLLGTRILWYFPINYVFFIVYAMYKNNIKVKLM